MVKDFKNKESSRKRPGDLLGMRMRELSPTYSSVTKVILRDTKRN
jgi:hypothetical protein